MTAAVFRTPFSMATSAGLLPGPPCRRRNPQPGRKLSPPVPPDQHRRRRPKPAITPTDFSIVNQPGAGSYPISGYSWALVYTHQTSQAAGQSLVTMLDWLTHGGQADAAANSYVPLQPRSSNSPAPCSSRSPVPAGHTC